MNTENRLLDLREFMEKEGMDLCIITNPLSQYYISGFKALMYSRPIVLVVTQNEKNLIIPCLEENHARHEADVNNLHVYYEHPEKAIENKNFLELLDDALLDHDANNSIGIEFNSISLDMSNLLKVKGIELKDIGRKIQKMRFIKDEKEIDYLVKSGELVSYALSKSFEKAQEGISELEFDSFGTKMLYEEISVKYPNATASELLIMSPSGIDRTNMPHVFSNTRKFLKNDIIIHSRQAGIYDYHAECERTFFIGEPTEKQREIFNVMVEAQQACMDFVKPGLKMSEVDAVARKIVRDAGYEDYFIHRAGHAIGLAFHEEPYIRFDSDVIIEENMVFSIEPGIYVPGIGGFRHSDTVIVNSKGAKVITDYPRNIDNLIF
jgi:Xaa-Pro dipeptidase